MCGYADLGLLKVKNIDLPEKLRRSPKRVQARKNKRILGRSIEERPAKVNDRTEFGHWEADLVIGSKSDNDDALTFAHPYTSCEKESVERHNGLIRRSIPKGKRVDSYTDEQVAEIEEWRTGPLRGDYPYVSVDGIFLKCSWGEEIRNISILVAIGVDDDGYREIIGTAEGMKEDKESWKNFFIDLKRRGLTGVRLVIGDKCLVMLESLGEVYPELPRSSKTVLMRSLPIYYFPSQHLNTSIAKSAAADVADSGQLIGLAGESLGEVAGHGVGAIAGGGAHRHQPQRDHRVELARGDDDHLLRCGLDGGLALEVFHRSREDPVGLARAHALGKRGGHEARLGSRARAFCAGAARGAAAGGWRGIGAGGHQRGGADRREG